MSKIPDDKDRSELTDFNEFPYDYSSGETVYFKYTPNTSVDIAHSLSAYKIILINNRTFTLKKCKKTFDYSMRVGKVKHYFI
jgi:hypothetical protein